MKKRCMILILLVFAGISLFSREVYHNEGADYSLEIPEGWTKIPDGVLAKDLEKMPLGSKVLNMTGFEAGNPALAANPKVYVAQFLGTLTWNKLLALVKKQEQDREKAVEAGTPGIQHYADTEIDEANHKITMYNIIGQPGADGILLIIVMIPGKERIMNATFYLEEKAYVEYLPDIRTIRDSLRFDDVAAYRPGITDKFPGIFSKAVGGILILLWVFWVWQKKRKGGKTTE